MPNMQSQGQDIGKKSFQTPKMTIGEVSKQTGIAVGALRYYESLGLLQSERGENNYRYYSPNAIQTVQFIKKSQTLGFSLNDIGEVLNVHQQGKVPCGMVRSLLQEKIDEIAAKIEEMTQFKAELEGYRDRWSQSHKPSESVVVQPDEICSLIASVSMR